MIIRASGTYAQDRWGRMDRLAELIEAVEIDWGNTLIRRGSSFWLQNRRPTYDISPNDFLHFARQALKEGDDAGCVNALTNAKRAIDCEVESFLAALGYPRGKDLPRSVSDYLARQGRTLRRPGLDAKLQLLQALNVVPVKLAARVRALRNDLEHEYALPQVEDVRDAIETADIFMRALRYVESWMLGEMELGSESPDREGCFTSDGTLWLEYKENLITVSLRECSREIDPLPIRADENGYLELVRLLVETVLESGLEDAICDLLASCGLNPHTSEVGVRLDWM